MSTGMATLEEIRDALLQFKESGKFIVSYADYYTQGSYYMATAADKVYLNPQGNVTWLGLASGVVFYKGLLDKLGVQVEAIRHGSFKSAVEPFILDKMSPENRLQMDALLGSIWGHVVKRVSDARGIDSAQLQRYASDLALQSARNTVDLKIAKRRRLRERRLELLPDGRRREQDRHQFVFLERELRFGHVPCELRLQQQIPSDTHRTRRLVLGLVSSIGLDRISSPSVPISVSVSLK